MDEKRPLMIRVSGTPGSGKTTVAGAVATLLESMGADVTLLDADSRVDHSRERLRQVLDGRKITVLAEQVRRG